MAKDLMIRNSTAEFLIFQAQTKEEFKQLILQQAFKGELTEVLT